MISSNPVIEPASLLVYDYPRGTDEETDAGHKQWNRSLNPGSLTSEPEISLIAWTHLTIFKQTCFPPTFLTYNWHVTFY